MKNRIAVYTCVTGKYDRFREPLVTEDCCDYYYISDDELIELEKCKWLDVDMIVPDTNMTPKDKNRYCKMHPYKIFSEYDYSIYLDGSIQIVKPISHYINRIGELGLAMHRHRVCDCVYSEGIFLTWLGVVEKEALVKDIKRYMVAGVPRHYGLFECGMIVTDLNNHRALKLYNDWYEEYKKGVKRDQQALIFALWKKGLACDCIGNLGGEYNILNNPDIIWSKGDHYK